MIYMQPPPHLKSILKATRNLNQADLLELIAYLVRQAQATSQTMLTWAEMEGIAPDLLEGRDAQEWVTQSRTESQRAFG